jgi:hypothetical protein
MSACLESGSGVSVISKPHLSLGSREIPASFISFSATFAVDSTVFFASS